MVQGIENLTALVVRVFDVSAHPSLGDWDQWDAEIVTATPIEGVADLLSQRIGERLPIAVPRELTADVAPGSLVACRARLNVGEVMVEPHPDPADFSVLPPDITA
jgi:hypothetical protein